MKPQYKSKCNRNRKAKFILKKAARMKRRQLSLPVSQKGPIRLRVNPYNLSVRFESCYFIVTMSIVE